ncbi:hypothetical protein [Pectobacterium polaris]|uniref:hypothetical protein n=1 Tax=Pectobacterium polaris TaxID=2042057 RepID=UPI000F8E9731|nr:hypothetical protein [Pectobacterium polaris]RUR91071.1 hypothetical protein KHDHEBDM_03934 [Pectobacterium polaris]
MTADKKKDGIFIIDRSVFLLACDIGLNAAVAYLIMARGSQGNNRTTRWSANAVSQHAGITRMRSQEAISQLIDKGIIELTQPGTRPQYKIELPDSDIEYIYLPNAIVDGVGKEIPPVERIRQTRNIITLKAFILLYSIQDLDNTGGMPLEMFIGDSSEHLCLYQNDVMKIVCCESSTWKINWTWYAKSSIFALVDIDFNDFKSSFDDIRSMGLLAVWGEVFDSPDIDGESIGVCWSYDSVAELDYQLRLGKKAFAKWPSQGLYMITSKHTQPCMKSVCRMTYRAQTTKTARWLAIYSKNRERCNSMYSSALNLETAKAIERE